MKKTFKGKTTNLYVNGTNMPSVKSTITAKLKQDSSIDYVVTLGAPFALTAVQSVADAGSKAKVATFDLNKEMVSAIEDGDIEFAVDQQPYLQGYLSVDALWLYKTNGNFSGGGQEPVLTGPAFVDKSNVDDHREVRREGHSVIPMSQATAPATSPSSPAPPAAPKDGRTSERSLARRLAARPEIGALIAAIAVYVFFFAVASPFREAGSLANVLYESSVMGIMALPVALLMIGGEFDLSAGVAVTTSALTASMWSFQLSMNVWTGVIVALRRVAGDRRVQRLHAGTHRAAVAS